MLQKSRALTIGIVAVLSACTADGPATPNLSHDGHLSAREALGPEQDHASLVARGVALALADAGLRDMVFQDLRDSPFPGHSLHLQSYFGGGHGRAVAISAADALGITAQAFLTRIHSLPVMALSVSSRLDRVTWTGSADVVVTASVTTRRQRAELPSLNGFDARGDLVAIPRDWKIKRPVLSILPAEFSFGADPEKRRAAAPKQNRETVSTAEEGTDPCSAETSEMPCEETGSIGWTFGPPLALGSDCLHNAAREVNADTDLDHDGLKDECERRFASSFQPQLVRHHDERYFGREPYWTVQLANNLVTIGYLLSYYYDGGAYGFTEHQGDSEFIIVRVVNHTGTDTWRVSSVTTSAHWGVCCGWDESKDTQGGGFDYTGARPYVFAARHKHANYEAEGRCDERFGDECSPIGGSNTEPVGYWLDRNIGNSQHPYTLMPGTPGGPDCTYSKNYPASRLGIECYLFANYTGAFAGWSNQSTSAYHYSTVLQYYGLY